LEIPTSIVSGSTIRVVPDVVLISNHVSGKTDIEAALTIPDSERMQIVAIINLFIEHHPQQKKPSHHQRQLGQIV
jgi:hypothetical protein